MSLSSYHQHYYTHFPIRQFGFRRVERLMCGHITCLLQVRCLPSPPICLVCLVIQESPSFSATLLPQVCSMDPMLASPGSLLDMQSLGRHPDLLHQTLCLTTALTPPPPQTVCLQAEISAELLHEPSKELLLQNPSGSSLPAGCSRGKTHLTP